MHMKMQHARHKLHKGRGEEQESNFDGVGPSNRSRNRNKSFYRSFGGGGGGEVIPQQMPPPSGGIDAACVDHYYNNFVRANAMLNLVVQHDIKSNKVSDLMALSRGGGFHGFGDESFRAVQRRSE